jgi:hypothetical protein
MFSPSPRCEQKRTSSSETPSRVAEQQPWGLLDNCETQNLEMLRNGTREKGDPLTHVSSQAPTCLHRLRKETRPTERDGKERSRSPIAFERERNKRETEAHH